MNKATHTLTSKNLKVLSFSSWRSSSVVMEELFMKIINSIGVN